MAREPKDQGRIDTHRQDWPLVVGAAAGLLTLVAFFGFALLVASGSAEYSCGTFTLLNIAFALGVGLSAAFVGGSSAVRGQLPANLGLPPIVLSAGGGIGALFIAFFVGATAQPADCDAPQTTAFLHFSKVPNQFSFDAASPLWLQKGAKDADPNVSNFHILVKDSRTASVFLYAVDKVLKTPFQACNVEVSIAPEQSNLVRLKRYRLGHETSLAELDHVVPLTIRQGWRPPETLDREFDTNCFSLWDGTVVHGAIAIATDRGTLQVADQPPVVAGVIPEAAAWALPKLISPANAQDSVLSFEEIAEALNDPLPTTRQSARLYLAEHFDNYRDQVIAGVLTRETPPLMLVGLLHALIAGIGQSEGGKWLPGQPRDLTTLPFDLNRNAGQLIDLTAHPDASVRQQARRLVQRYPADAFDAIYRPIVQQAATAGCPRFPPDEAYQQTLYGSAFYYYNRFIQQYFDLAQANAIGVKVNLPESLAAEMTSDAELVSTAASNCLQPPLRVDAAVVDYGLALVASYSNNGELTAQTAASNFLEFAGPSLGEYYLQGHVQQIQAIAGAGGDQR